MLKKELIQHQKLKSSIWNIETSNKNNKLIFCLRTLLQINTVVNSGSTGRIAEDIGQLAISKNWKSYIAYGRNERPSKSNLIKIGNNWDIKWHGLQTRLFDKHGLGSINATNKLVKQIKEIAPDIIHIHNIHGYYLNIKILFNYLSKTEIPVIWTLHDCWPITGHCVYFDFVGCHKWKTQCYACPQKYTYPASYFFDRSRLNYKLKSEFFRSSSNLTLVPVSNWLAGILRESFLSKKSIQVIHNGINNNVFHPLHKKIKIREKYNLKNRFIILGVASVWSPRKGLNDFVELSEKLNPNYQIILVGLSKKQIRTLPSNILGIEKTEDVNELVELYSASDVFVNPTYEDNFPTTNLEAMACGTPVITYKTGGSPEAIDENTGIVVENGNIEELIKAITQILRKGKESYSKDCIQRVYDHFRKEDRFNEYLQLYESRLK